MELPDKINSQRLNDTFFEHLKESFAFREDELLAPSTEFRKHWNWNSMTGLLTQCMFLSEYGVQVSTDEFIACKTFQDIYDLINRKIESECIA